MLEEATISSITTKNRLLPYLISRGSRVERIDQTNIPGYWPIIILARLGFLQRISNYRSLPSPFEVDSSSVLPQFEPVSRTSFGDETKEIFLAEALEGDIVIRVPPVSEGTIRVKVKSIERAVPRVIEPEEF